MNARRSCLLLIIAAATTTHCTEPEEPEEFLVQTVTTGGDFDLDGYIVVVNGQEYPTEPNEQIRVDVAAGVHPFELRGVAANCDITTNGKRQASATADGRTHILFEVQCDPTGIEIATSVDGLDLDRWYEVFLDNAQRFEFAKLNGKVAVTRITPGTYAVRLGTESNCHLGPASQTVEVRFRTMTAVEFTGTCMAATGVVRARVNQSGEDLDVSGFGVSLDGEAAIGVPGKEFLFTSVMPGARRVRLSGIATNCALAEENPTQVTVKAGGATRDTATVNFTVSCSRQWEIAFSRDGRVALATRDGGKVDVGQPGQQAGAPKWASDGRRLAFGCGRICIADLQTGRVDTVGENINAWSLNWRPDGSQLVATDVFCTDDWGMECVVRGLVLIAPGIREITRIPLPPLVLFASDPSWSPDRTIVFACRVPGPAADRICAIGADGSWFRQLTAGDGPWQDFAPSFSPDGRKIAFATSRFGPLEIAVMNADGTGIVRLAQRAVGTDPTWLPDGTRILYSGRNGLTVVNLDGSGAQRLTTNEGDNHGSWRP
jgi:hypothetical protein